MSSISSIGPISTDIFKLNGINSSDTKSSGREKANSSEKEQEVSKLRRRDTEVKAHEAAHSGAGGQYVRGGASYEFQTGPNGRSYAVGGEVSIDTSPISGNPEATITKMQTIIRAAMAPANPSGQDRNVAAAASSAMVSAQNELSQTNSATGASPNGGSQNKNSGHSSYSPNGKSIKVSLFTPQIDIQA